MVHIRRQREAAGPFDGVIPEIYDAALEPARWRAVLSRLADAVDLYGMHFVAFAESGGLPHFSVVSERVPLESHDGYVAYYGGLDPRIPIINRLSAGEFMLCHEHIDEAFVRRSEFHNDFLIPHGFRYAMGVSLLQERGEKVVAGFLKRLGQPPVDRREAEMFYRLVPHLSRAARIQSRLCSLEATSQALSDALDHASLGIAILDRHGRVKFINRAADTLAAAGDVLCVRQGRLVATDEGAAPRLQRMIAEAALCAAGLAPEGGGTLALSREGDAALLVLVAPLSAARAERMACGEPAAIVVISDPARRPADAAGIFAALFGLTAAEARLCVRLAAGESLDEAAAGLGLSKNTLRAQLRALMAKTGTNRQAALVRLLAGAAALSSG